MAEAVKQAIGQRDGWICQLCDKPINRLAVYPHPLCATVDHRLPRSAGGSNRADNLQITHKLCNELRSQAPLESLDLTALRGRFDQAWARYQRRHPQVDQELILQVVPETRAAARAAERAARRAQAEIKAQARPATPARLPLELLPTIALPKRPAGEGTGSLLILALPAFGTLGRRSCMICHKRTSGPGSHVCSGHGQRVSALTRRAVCIRDGWICQLCHEPVDPQVPTGHPFAATVDHCLPRSAGGPSRPENLQLAHKMCNELRDTIPLESLDFGQLRARFSQAWARYLKTHPYGDPAQVIEQRAHRREMRRAAQVRRTARRAQARAAALAAAALSPETLVPIAAPVGADQSIAA